MNEEIIEIEDNRFHLKYVVMNPELFLNNKLNKIDCLVFCIIEFYDGEDHCFASNEHIAKILNVTTTTISTSISRLKEEKYINQISFDGRKRILSVNSDYKKIYNQLLKGLNSRVKRPLKYNNNKYNNNRITLFSSKEEENKSDSDESLITSNHIEIKRRNKNELKRKILSSIQPTNNSIQEKKSLQITSIIKEVFDFWLEQNLLLPKEETKSYNDCIKNVKGLLSGRLFGEKYSIEQIKESILNFSFAAIDNDFEPSNIVYKKILSKKKIGEFIYNSFSKNEEKSLFQYYLKNKPKPIKSKEVIEDKYPIMTKQLKKLYENEVLGKTKVNYTQKDENCFIASAIKLKEFYNNNSSKFNQYMIAHDINLSNWLFEAIKADCYGDVSKISPGWFSSNTTFNRRLPAYLFRQNIIEESDDKFIRFNDNFSKNDDLQINY
jgi:DNA-binding MarR family transcriptional regulator